MVDNRSTNSRTSCSHLRRGLLLSVVGLLTIVIWFAPGCDKEPPTSSQDNGQEDTADTAGDLNDTVVWGQDTVYVLQIETTASSIQGMHAFVGVVLKRSQHRMGGFDFMFAYDASALSFQAAIPRAPFEFCRWEYFNYRFGPNGNCDPICPSGMLEVVGIAETNNGPYHPDWVCTDSLAAHDPDTLFAFDFLVTNDRTFECRFVPIRFFWTNCTDNSIAYHPADDPFASIQGVSRLVFDNPRLTDPISDEQVGFPTYQGTQVECFPDSNLHRPAPVRIVDFINGGVDIVCADSIDFRGDINLNGHSNEIADAVLFSNYFVHGAGVFNIDYDAQVAASDVNKNGVPLEVADLVYLIRIIVGDALPYQDLNPVAGSLTLSGGVFAISLRAGAAYVVVEGDVNPTLLNNLMEMNHAFDGVNTRILISKIEQGAYFEGNFLELDGNIVSVECATYDGAPIDLTIDEE